MPQQQISIVLFAAQVMSLSIFNTVHALANAGAAALGPAAYPQFAVLSTIAAAGLAWWRFR